MATWRAVSLVLTSSCFPAALASTSGPNSGKAWNILLVRFTQIWVYASTSRNWLPDATGPKRICKIAQTLSVASLHPRKMSGTSLDLQSASHRYFQQLVQALPFLQGMASCRNGFSGFSGLFSPFDADPFLFLATQVQGSSGNTINSATNWKTEGYQIVQNQKKWDVTWCYYTSSCFHEMSASLCQVISCKTGQDAKKQKDVTWRGRFSLSLLWKQLLK